METESVYTYQTRECFACDKFAKKKKNTVKPVYNGHPWEMARRPLYTGSPLLYRSILQNIRQLKI